MMPPHERIKLLLFRLLEQKPDSRFGNAIKNIINKRNRRVEERKKSF
jgi:hypothetical protein